MEKMQRLMKEIEILPNCPILEPSGLPDIDESRQLLPDDLKEFYYLCGGIALFVIVFSFSRLNVALNQI